MGARVSRDVCDCEAAASIASTGPLPFHPATTRENDRRFDLTLGDRPVIPKQPRCVLSGEKRVSIALVEPDGPRCIRPGADQERLVDQRFDMVKKPRSDAAALNCRVDVRMAYQRHIALVLNSHHTCDASVMLRNPENDTALDLGRELISRNVGVVPAIDRYHSAICSRGVIDDSQYRGEISFEALSNRHRQASVMTTFPLWRPEPKCRKASGTSLSSYGPSITGTILPASKSSVICSSPTFALSIRTRMCFFLTLEFHGDRSSAGRSRAIDPPSTTYTPLRLKARVQSLTDRLAFTSRTRS